MKLLTTFLTWALALGAFDAGAATLLGADGSGGNPSSLMRIDPATGSVLEVIGAIEDAGGNGIAVTGLAVSPLDGKLYASQANAQGRNLYEIDPATGAATLVGSLDNGFTETAADLSFGPDGTLYGWFEAGTDDLHSIDTSTGMPTLVGDAGLSTACAGLVVNSASTALMFDCFQMHEISLLDGSVLSTTSISGTFNDVGLGVDIDPMTGTLYAIEKTSQTERNLLTVDALGNVTVVGATAARLDALVFVPEPAMLALLGSGLLALALRGGRPR